MSNKKLLNIYEWLTDYQDLQKRIAYLEHKIKRSKQELSRWESGDLSNQPLTKDSIAADLINGTYIKRDETELAHLINLRFDLVKFVNQFDDLDSKILKLKYIDGLSLYEIAERTGYSYMHIRRCHSSLARVIQAYDKFLLDYLS